MQLDCRPKPGSWRRHCMFSRMHVLWACLTQHSQCNAANTATAIAAVKHQVDIALHRASDRECARVLAGAGSRGAVGLEEQARHEHEALDQTQPPGGRKAVLRDSEQVPHVHKEQRD